MVVEIGFTAAERCIESVVRQLDLGLRHGRLRLVLSWVCRGDLPVRAPQAARPEQ